MKHEKLLSTFLNAWLSGVNESTDEYLLKSDEYMLRSLKDEDVPEFVTYRLHGAGRLEIAKTSESNDEEQVRLRRIGHKGMVLGEYETTRRSKKSRKKT